MAVTEAGSPLRIGVCGPTPEAARSRFAEELGEWVKLLGDEAQAEAGNGVTNGT
jgi:hypothetical protein